MNFANFLLSFTRPYTSLRPMLTPEFKSYSANVTVRHWQLRDLVSVNSRMSDEIMYPREKQVHSLNLSKNKTNVVTEFDFEPRCIQTYNDVVAVGALQDNGGRTQARNSTRGLFAVHNRHTGLNLSQDIGECINNSISLYSDNPVSDTSQVKAIVCNNDFNLYFVDIDTSRITIAGKTKFKVALNHASISPDRKTIIACGDTQQLYVCHPESGHSAPTIINSTPYAWSVSDTLDSWSSFGFSTAFHSSGLIFGAAFETGIAHLYDMRNLSQPLTKIYSTRPHQIFGAFRCLKFSQGLEDMVFVSEQMSRVHAIDLRDFDNHQVLTVPKKLSTGEGLETKGDVADRDGQDTPFTWESDAGLVRQYSDMLKTGYATEFNNSHEDALHVGISPNRPSHHPSRRHSSTSNSPQPSAALPDDHESPFDDVEQEIPEIPSSSVFRSANRRWRRNSNTGAGWDDFIGRGESIDAVRQEFISPLRDFSGFQITPASGSHSRSQSFGALATTQAAARRTLLLEQQLSETYSGSRTGAGNSATSSMRSSPALASSPASPRRASNIDTSANPGTGHQTRFSYNNNDDYSNSWPRPMNDTVYQPRRVRHSPGGPTGSTVPFRSLYPNIPTLEPTHSRGGGTGGGVNDYGVSGISWTEHGGGSLVVGSDRGIGVWKVDTLASRTFPNYEQR